MKKQFEFPEGATPIADCSGLIPFWVHHLNDLNRVEAENIMSAQKKYLRKTIDDPKIWFQITQLRSIHRAMFGKVWDWAGVYRKSVTSIGINPGLIPARLAELCFDVLAWLQCPVELTFIEMAARIHHRLVFIHPFENGNGRFSRLVADRFLLAFNLPYPMWPNHLNRDGIARKDYIQTLKSADKGDYDPLIDFMEKLGATDPKLNELFTNKFYRTYIHGEKGPAMVKAFIRRGSNLNDQTVTGHRLLQLAIKLGFDKIVKILVDSGAEIDVKDCSGLTPFQMAVLQKNQELADFFYQKVQKNNCLG